MNKYQDPKLSVDKRVDDLLSQMTLTEKIGQLNQKMLGWDAYRYAGDTLELTQEFKDEVEFGNGLGAIYGLFRADPWSKVSFDNGVSPKDNLKLARMVQDYAAKHTRLGIPVLICEECPHGHQALDGTIFPTNIGIGSTWNPALYEEQSALVASEIWARGANVGLISALDVLRDPRWGRSEECYSEDPFLSAAMAGAAVRGLQGRDRAELSSGNKIAAVVKHFCAQGASAGGHNGKGVPIGQREVREIHLPAAKAAAENGACGFMAAYNDIDGIYCHANKWLLTDVLRGEWGFDGFVMSDGLAVDNLVGIAGSYVKAGAIAIKAGVDVNLWNISFTKLQQAVHDGHLTESIIDQAVRRVLNVKFLLGLFDETTPDSVPTPNAGLSQASGALNLRVASESIVLLKNDSSFLPLSKAIERVAVIGPNADFLYNQLGDYTPPQREDAGFTILKGIKSVVSPATEVLYSEGCSVLSDNVNSIDEAVQMARISDVAVLVLGGSSSRYSNVRFDSNGAAIPTESSAEMDCGEGLDVADLQLGGRQIDLAVAVARTGTPVVIVLIQGRPYAIPELIDISTAIVCAWYPGQEGGLAVAQMLFGDGNPSGKLPVSMPRSAGQLPVYYNHRGTMDYVDCSAAPLFPFGFGLSKFVKCCCQACIQRIGVNPFLHYNGAFSILVPK